MDDIMITPRMMDAGITALADKGLADEDAGHVVTAVFLAMVRAAREAGADPMEEARSAVPGAE